MQIEPFTVDIDDDVLADLRQRIHNTRWPDQITGIGWDQGCELGFLQRLLATWADEFDWRAQERDLNRFHHLRVQLDDVSIHCVHERALSGAGIPLVLTHGWPSTFVDLLAMVPLLTDPAAHGLPGPGFDVVIPSLPGYGFSTRPDRTGVTTRYVAGLWHRLMQGLGYRRYGAHGGDFGAAVATFMALTAPASMIGIHLSNLDNFPYTGPGSRPLSPAEQAYVQANQRWSDVERGYSSIQSTKPQTVGYGLNDSPAGLAAWIVEKWRSWSDSRGDITARISTDFLLTTLTIFWATGSITSSMRDYYDNRWHASDLGPDDYVDTPTGMAVFDHEFVPEGTPPREWVERLYRVVRWTPMPSGGHFASVEEPLLLAEDICSFFTELSQASAASGDPTRGTA